MKTRFILTIIILSCFFVNCEKEPQTRCFTCETTIISEIYENNTTLLIEGLPHTEYIVEAVCGFDKEGIRLYEISKSDTTIQTTVGIKIQHRKVMKCH